MSENSASPPPPHRVRHDIRVRRAVVRDILRVTPHRLRITFAGPDLVGFVSPGYDDHIKLIIPDAETGVLHLPSVGPNGIVWPEGMAKPTMRDYTPRAFDSAAGTLTIGFSLHDAGPVTAWADRAAPGDEVGIAGPRGSFIVSAEYDWHLFIGDDTTLPAVSRRLEELPAHVRAIVLLEVEEHADEVPLRSPAKLEVHWHHRTGDGQINSENLYTTLTTLPWPEGQGFVWIGGESGMVRQSRTHVVRDRAHDPKLVRASGYWRRGTSNVHDTIED
ncbi:MAG: siderophore-interacting protein [Gemmatimonadaceae bacterium]|nr:siderophore-interacting protein [Gemmatimonadaceae bacterium]